MLDPNTTIMSERAHELRQLWTRLSERAGSRPIAIYGGGEHTMALLEIVLDDQSARKNGPRVQFIIDDFPSETTEIFSIPVVRPAEASPNDVALVLVSSDSIEPKLAARAHLWADSGTCKRIPIVRIYGDVAMRRPREEEKYRNVWGRAGFERQGHLPMMPGSPVLRFPAVTERAPGAPLPVPPPALRAGYSVDDDAAYLASGKRDVDAMRGLISQHAPANLPLRRVLDWGCSTGRMIRHWADVAAAGGEVWGCDICATAVNWNVENLAPPFKFFQATYHPSLPFPDASLDLVYANSVFTHIRDLVEAWLMELRRIVRPGGLLLATILDENSWEFCRANPGNALSGRYEIEFDGPMKDDCVSSGEGVRNLTFWHSRGIRRRWSFAFDVVAIEPGLVPYQTGVLLRRPA